MKPPKGPDNKFSFSFPQSSPFPIPNSSGLQSLPRPPEEFSGRGQGSESGNWPTQGPVLSPFRMRPPVNLGHCPLDEGAF